MEDIGEESEDDDNDVEEMLAKLNEVTERFEALNESYQKKLEESEKSRKVKLILYMHSNLGIFS